MPPPKKDEPGYAEYREQYALCDQSQLVDYATVDIPASSTANNVVGARSTRIMFRTIAFPYLGERAGVRRGCRGYGRRGGVCSFEAARGWLLSLSSPDGGVTGFPVMPPTRPR